MTLSCFQDKCNKPLCHLSILADFKVQFSDFTSSSLFLIKKFFSREVTINLPLYIIGYHDNFVKVKGTNFIVLNSHLVGTSTELNFASACQFCSTFFASDCNHLIAFNLNWTWELQDLNL